MELKEADLKIFVDAVAHYFSQLTREAAVIHSAYLADKGIACFRYTGLIAVSGQFRGCVYFSTNKPLLLDLLKECHESDTSEDNLLDAVGEIANTIAGNARRHFGKELQISVPVTMQGLSETIKAAVRVRPFVILLRWHQHDAAVVVDLEPAG